MTVRWGILGTGRIAGVFARGLLQSATGRLVAVASRSQGKAEAWGADFLQGQTVTRHGSYEALLADPHVDAVYIATPHPLHPLWAIRCMEAGKHVLSEKPLGLNHADAMVVLEAARRLRRFCMEAFMYRCHPLVSRTVELIRAGAIGEVRAISATFAFNAGTGNPTGRLMNNALGGGGILDVGCYPISMARLVAGVATGGTIAEPSDVKAVGRIGSTQVDDYTFAVLKFPGDIVASCGTGVQVSMDNAVRVFGSSGSITMTRWVPLDAGNKLIVSRGGKTEEVDADSPVGAYALEAEAAARAIEAGRLEAEFPAMTWADTLGNMRTLDRWREQIGLVYEAEQPAQRTAPVHGRALAVRAESFMEYGRLAGLDKPIARLVMGVDNQRIERYAHAAAMFDDYFERGGNAFDTAYIYGGGGCEKALGAWHSSRGVRGQIVLLDKGAHTPHCYPADLARQLGESLERLQTSYVDIYMMHRDNPDVPVGEFVDVLNAQQQAGRMRLFGLSNWTLERLDAFADYARRKGLNSYGAVSNNYSLARMVEAPWKGCIAASEPAYQRWHEQTKMPLMPWSSQARGFFVRGAPAFTDDAELVRCWYSDDNFERLKRARALAEKKHALPIQIALAYVLRQDFPTFPLIGPRTIEETESSCEALRVELSPAEVRWLNLEQ